MSNFGPAYITGRTVEGQPFAIRLFRPMRSSAAYVARDRREDARVFGEVAFKIAYAPESFSTQPRHSYIIVSNA